MRSVHPKIQELILGGVYSAFLVINLELKKKLTNTTFETKVVRTTTLPYDVKINNIDYLSDSYLSTLETPKMSSARTKDSFTLKLADSNQTLKDYTTGSIGSYCDIQVGFINTTGKDFYEFAPYDPILSSQYLMKYYRGRIDSLQYIQSDDGGDILEIKLGSPFSALDATNVFYLTSYSLKQKFGTDADGDTSLDTAIIKGTTQSIEWGKI
jgi:hypothetical protein